MENDDAHPDWRGRVRAFAEGLRGQQTHFGVQDLCRFLIEEPSWKNQDEVLAYIRDYIHVSEAQKGFHSKWSQLRNMTNLARHDQGEIEKIRELIKVIE